MNHHFVLSVVSVASLSAASAFAGPYAELVESLNANIPRGLCLATSDGCKKVNSDSFKAMKAVIDSGGTPVVIEFALYGQALVTKAKKIAAVTSKYQQAQIRNAAEAVVDGTLKGYANAYGPGRVTAAIEAVGGAVAKAIETFTAIEAEAAKVTAGREAYLRAREGDFNNVAAEVAQSMGTLGALAGGEKYVADSLNGSLPVDPRAVFVNKCSFDGIFEGAAVDLVADYDFIARLTNARNLTLECVDTTDYFMGIAESSDAKYSKKYHRLKFWIGDDSAGNFSSKSAYAYTRFSQAYAKLKREF